MPYRLPTRFFLGCYVCELFEKMHPDCAMVVVFSSRIHIKHLRTWHRSVHYNLYKSTHVKKRHASIVLSYWFKCCVLRSSIYFHSTPYKSNVGTSVAGLIYFQTKHCWLSISTFTSMMENRKKHSNPPILKRQSHSSLQHGWFICNGADFCSLLTAWNLQDLQLQFQSEFWLKYMEEHLYS